MQVMSVVNLCRENYITLLGFSSHTCHRMQPLGVSLKNYICKDFLSNNPGRVITLHDPRSLFGKAYLKVPQ